MRAGYRLPCLFAFLLLVLASNTYAQDSLPALVKKVQPAVVTVIVYDGKGTVLKQGSGFFIDEIGSVVSNRHVLQGGARAVIRTASGLEYPVELIAAEDIDGDLIKLSITSAQKMPYLQASSFIPEAGQRVVVIGSPLGLEQSVTEGVVSSIREIPTIGKIIQMSAPISAGSSGSPVVNLRGELVGVATSQMVQGQNVNFAMPAQRLSALKSTKGQTLAEWRSGATEGAAVTPKALSHMGFAFILSKDYDKALPFFKKAVEIDAAEASAWEGIALCHYILGHYDEAIEAYKRVIQIEPNDANTHWFLADTYSAAKRQQEAIEEYKRAIAIQPDDPEIKCSLALAYDTARRYEEATEVFKQVLQIKPDNASAQKLLGLEYVSLGRLQDAAGAFQRLIQLTPDDAMAHSFLGMALFQLGQHDEGIKEIKEAIRLKPDEADPHVSLGLAYVESGNVDSAIEQFRILQKINRDKAQGLYLAITRSTSERAVKGVTASDFMWSSITPKPPDFSITISNDLRVPIEDVHCLVIFYDTNGKQIDTCDVRYQGIIQPGLAKRVSGTVDITVRWMTTPNYATLPTTKVELRLISFEISSRQE